jgi:hypothetical protein
VFLSYRRNDSPHASGRLRDRLAMEFGEENVFYDVDSIPTGRDFREAIRTAIQAADVVVVMIGPGFDVDRLNDRRDYVRMELLEAFRQNKVIVPVLVDTASMPAAAALPSSLRKLAYINASPIRQDPDFRRDSERLIADLRDEPAISGIVYADRQSRLDTTRDGQLADRYSRSIEQLGSDNLDIRVGGIYALEGIAQDSVRHHLTVMELLAVFIREHSREQRPLPEPGDAAVPERMTRPDVQAALTVIGRRAAAHDRQGSSIDLSGANLSRANLGSANFANADLRGADLTGTNLADANLVTGHLNGANLARAQLIGADLSDADLSDADLTRADLTGADLTGANLPRATLAVADFTNAKLTSARLNDADLTRAKLARADLTGAHLRGAKLTLTNLAEAKLTDAVLTGAVLTSTVLYHTDLSRVDLTNAQWFGNEPPPNGWIPDPGSGQLRRQHGR